MSAVLVMAGALQAAPHAAHVMDARTGETLYAKNAGTRLHPASLTKMMTLYIAFEELSRGTMTLDTRVTVTAHAAGQPPSRLGLRPGQKIALRFLIRAAAIKSANDAATAIGEHISGSEAAFAKRMTRTARALGMRNTTFRNANGLTAEGHLSTAEDMSILGRALFYNFPQYYNIFARRTADAGMAQVANTNRRFLDSYEGADGIKTGYTVAAGFNLTASAERGGRRIIATVFGGTSTANRNAKMAELLDIGFATAPGQGRVAPPDPAPQVEVDPALIAEAMAEDEAPGGAAKTVRVTGEVARSPRPKARPEVAAPAALAAEGGPVDDVALAIAASVGGALAAEPPPDSSPPPPGTLDAQAAALAAPQDTAAPAPPPPGTLDAQAAALAAPGTLPDQAEALADTAALAALRPAPRPEGLAPPAAADPAAAAPDAPPATTAEQLAAITAPGVREVVTMDPTLPETPPGALAPAAAADTALALAEAGPAAPPGLDGVETVAGAVLPAAPPAAPVRRAPIFDRVDTVAAAPAPEPEPEVVVRVSTSGGRHFGVAVGAYSSRAEADRALFKLALSDSAALSGGLRKVTDRGGKYRATFMGLTEGQAELACRRLRARAIECETIGS